MIKKKSFSILLWCVGATVVLSLLALLYYRFFYKPDMLLGRVADLEKAFSSRVELPQNAYLSDEGVQYFEKGNFKGTYRMYGGTYEPMRLLGEEMLAETNPGGLGKENCVRLSDGSLVLVPNWIRSAINRDGGNHSHLDSQEEMAYQAEIKYQNGPFFLYGFISCSDPKNVGGCRALYEDMVKYLNHSARAYEGCQNWEGQTDGWYSAP